MNKDLDQFGKLFIEFVRDDAVEFVEKLIAGKMKPPDLQRLQERLGELHEDELLRKFGREIVATTVHNALWFFEQPHNYKITSPSGEDLVEKSDGFSGELYGERGWIARYSKYPDVGQ